MKVTKFVDYIATVIFFVFFGSRSVADLQISGISYHKDPVRIHFPGQKGQKNGLVSMITVCHIKDKVTDEG